MPMSHLGYSLYGAMVIALYGSPVFAYLLWRGWKRGRFMVTLLGCLVCIFGGGALAYGLLRVGVELMAMFA